METLVNNIAHVAINKTGGTFETSTGNAPQIKTGFWVGGAGTCYIIPYEFITGAKYLKSLLSKVVPKISNTGAIGVWYQEDTNAVYIEPTEHFNSKYTAYEKGTERKQIAIFDIENQKDIVLW